MRFDHSTALAANWKTVLAVDIAMAAAVVAGGVVLGLVASGWGWALAAVGLVYLFFAVGRAVKWARIRRQTGD
jgi:hypothetical protein